MDIVPILSTIILIATIMTLIIAVSAYVMFRLKEKRRGQFKTSGRITSQIVDGTSMAAEVNAVKKMMETGGEAPGAKPHLGPAAPLPSVVPNVPDGKPHIPGAPPSAPQAAPTIVNVYNPPPAAPDVKTAPSTPPPPAPKLGKAQAAFLQSLKVTGTELPESAQEESESDADEPSLRRFTLHKPRGAKKNLTPPKADDNATWK